jgi:hypothetical protein
MIKIQRYVNSNTKIEVIVNNETVSLIIDEKIPEYTAFYKVSFGNIDVTKQYYSFLQKHKLTNKNWRYNKNKNHFSIGFSSSYAIFNIEDKLLIDFIKSII